MADASRLWTIAETARFLRVGRGKARVLAERAGALWLVGDTPRVHMDWLRRALDAGELAEPAPSRRRGVPAGSPMLGRPALIHVGPFSAAPHRYAKTRGVWSWRVRRYQGGAEQTSHFRAMHRDDAYSHLLKLAQASSGLPASGRSTGAMSGLTIGQVLSSYSQAVERRVDIATSTRKVKVSRCRVLTGLVVAGRPLGDLFAMQLDDALVEAVIAARGESVGAGTIRGDVSLLRDAMRRAVRRGEIDGWVEPEWPRISYRPTNGSRAPTPEQLTAFFKALEQDHQRVGGYAGLVLYLQYQTGCRIDEIAAAVRGAWRIDDADPVLMIQSGKTGDREVPLTAEAVRVVRVVSELWGSPHGTLWPIKPASIKAGVYRKLGELGLGIRPHSLRAAAGQRMVDAGADIRVVADILGNSPEVLSRVYLSSTRAKRRAAVDARWPTEQADGQYTDRYTSPEARTTTEPSFFVCIAKSLW